MGNNCTACKDDIRESNIDNPSNRILEDKNQANNMVETQYVENFRYESGK